MKNAVVIATYEVKKENQRRFVELLKRKRDYFLKAGYITGRQAVVLRSRKKKEFLLEIFEWKSEKHVRMAHDDKKVREIWELLENLWENGGFGLEKIPEAKDSFAHFEPV